MVHFSQTSENPDPMPLSVTTPWALGGLPLATRAVLAPMAGYTDLPFRRLVRSFGGVGLAFSEMVNPDSILRGRSRKVSALVATAPDDRPLGWQIYGTKPGLLAEAAQWFEARGAELIDVNMGCPQKKICSRGAGAALMKTPELAVEIARRVVESVKIPVTVKIRLGWNAPDAAAELARGLEAAGAAALTVHGRTRAQRFSGAVDLDGIRQVVEAVRVPVIANGDVFTLAAAREMLERTGAAAIMIGRHTLSEPWFLRDVARDLAGEPPLAAPCFAERLAMMRRLYADHIQLYGERFGVSLFRRWIPRFAKGMGVPRPMMIAFLQAATPAEWEARMAEVERGAGV